METPEEFKERRIAELQHEIKGVEMYLERSKPPVTIESGSGSWKARKNKQYAGHHSARISEMEDRLVSLNNQLSKIEKL